MAKDKVGIIGSGMVAQALAAGFLKNGWEVMMGSRDTRKLAEWQAKTKSKGKIGSFFDAARFGKTVVLAVKGSGAENALRQAGVDSLSGKIIIDTCNPISEDAPEEGVLRYFTGPNDSLLERLQRLAPKARFVKAFSCIGSALMVTPKFAGGKPTMFICGNDSEAKKFVSGIVEQFGFEIADMGMSQAARAIEPLAMLWCIPGLRENHWTHAFKLLRS